MSKLLVISANDVKQLLQHYITPSEVLANQAHVFKALNAPSASAAAPTFQAPPRISLQLENATSLFMPARLQEEVTCKIVGVPSVSSGLSAATVVLDGLGTTKALVNATSLTALRTAAGSALATLALCGGPTAQTKRITIFGSGQQALHHASLFSSLYGGALITFIVRSGLPDAIWTDLVASGVRKSDVSVTLSEKREEVEEAVSQADMIVCCTPSQQPLFPSKWVKSGTHIVLVGSYKPAMQEVEEDLVQRAIGRLILDDADACASEAGDLIKAGVDARKCISLGELISQESLADLANGHINMLPTQQQIHSMLTTLNSRLDQTKMGDVSMFKSVGVGLQDVAMTSLVVQKAKEQGLGTLVDF